MAASQGPINGNLMYLYLNGVAVYRCTGITINATSDMIDVTSQTSAGARDIIPGLRSWNGSCDMIMDMSGTLSGEALSIAQKAGTQYGLKLIQLTSTGVHVHGDGYWHGSCYISGYTVNVAPNDKVTFSCTFEGDGELICSVYT